MGIPFILRSGDCISSTLGSISNTLVDLELSRHMCEKERDGRIAASIGSLTHYSRDISPTVNLKLTNKVMMTPLAMMLMTVLT